MPIIEGTTKDAEMPPDTPDRVPTYSGRGVRWLAVAHVAAGVIAALLANAASARPDLARGAFVGTWYGQTSLLGIWLGFGVSPHVTRVMGVVLGVTVLYLSMGLASGDWSAASLIAVGVSIAFVSTPLLLARCYRIVIQVDSSPTTLASRLRFSIRHLLVLTFMVACAITLGRIVLPDNPQRQFILGVMVYGTTFQMIGVVPVWLILATKQPVVYGIGLVAISACSGYSLGWIIGFPARVQTMIGLATGAMVVVVSLLVVRRCGYRLVRLPKSTPRGSRLDEFTTPHISNPASQSGSVSN